VGDAIPGLAGYERGEPRFVTAYARMMRRFGSDEVSQKMVDSLFAEHGDDPIWLKGLGDVYIEGKGNIEKASEYYGAALEQLPSYRPALLSWLDLLAAKKEYGKAVELCDRYSDMVNANPELSLKKAEYLARQGVDDQAYDIFRSNFQYLKGRSVAVRVMAELGFSHGNDVAAWELVDHCLTANPGSRNAYTLFAELAFTQNDQERLTEYICKGLELDPRSIPLRALRARTMCAEGQLEEAAAVFGQIEADRNLRPGYADAMMHHSRCLADVPVEQQRGENLARSAVNLDGSSERTMINLVSVYYQYGRYDLARGEARRTCSSHPDNAEAFYFLGMCYYKTDHPDARKGLERAIELGLSGEKLATARETLEKL
jgi:tetratricopeptide (TPR) repeat protein